MNDQYPIAKSDRQRSKLTPEQKLANRRKYNHKKRSEINKRRANRRWERIHLPPELWTRHDISQRVELCSRCRLYKPVGQFILNFSQVCIRCRKPNLQPLDKNITK